jgi:hypothetical protein
LYGPCDHSPSGFRREGHQGFLRFSPSSTKWQRGGTSREMRLCLRLSRLPHETFRQDFRGCGLLGRGSAACLDGRLFLTGVTSRVGHDGWLGSNTLFPRVIHNALALSQPVNDGSDPCTRGGREVVPVPQLIPAFPSAESQSASAKLPISRPAVSGSLDSQPLQCEEVDHCEGDQNTNS